MLRAKVPFLFRLFRVRLRLFLALFQLLLYYSLFTIFGGEVPQLVYAVVTNRVVIFEGDLRDTRVLLEMPTRMASGSNREFSIFVESWSQTCSYAIVSKRESHRRMVINFPRNRWTITHGRCFFERRRPYEPSFDSLSCFQYTVAIVKMPAFFEHLFHIYFINIMSCF